MQVFTVTSPNTCGLIEIDGGLTYVSVVGSETYTVDSATFTQYLTPEDALTAALLIEPSFSPNTILGMLQLSPVNLSSQEISATYGSSVTFDCEYECSDPTATITYQWKDFSGTDIPGATSSSYTLTGVSPAMEGTYDCAVSASNPAGQTGAAYYGINLKVSEIRGQFTLTRSGNNITTGLFSLLSGFSATSATIEVPSASLTISYDPVDGFKTTGSPLLAVDQAAELFIGDAFVKSITIHPVDGTFNYNFIA